jgi:hypothetical protein
MGNGRGVSLTFQAKLLPVLATLTFVSVMTVAALSISSVIRTGHIAKIIGSSTLQCQIDDSLTHFILSSAKDTDLELEGVRRDVLVTDDNVVSLTYLEPEGQG